MRLVSFGQHDEPIWITERDKIIAAAQGLKFMDVTETPDLASFAAPAFKKDYSACLIHLSSREGRGAELGVMDPS